MFAENIEIIKKCFEEYKGFGMYLALFFISLLYIFLKEKNKNVKVVLGIYSITMLCIILNPIFNKIVNSFINVNTYWRLFWLLPMGITIAYVAVQIISERDNKIERILVGISICLIIASSGKFIYNNQGYIKYDNWYKVPDEAKMIAYIIGADENERKKVMLPETLVPYIRQVDATIELAYGRQPHDYFGNDALLHLNDGNVKYITDVGKERKWNYIIFKRETVLSISPEYFDYKLFAQTENYDIYKLNEVK